MRASFAWFHLPARFVGTCLVASIAACTVTTTDGSGDGTTGGPQPSGITAHSEAVPTNKMHPSLSAQDYGDGSGVHVYAAWLNDQGQWLETSGGDVARASDGARAPVVLFVESDVPDKVHYTTTFPSTSASHEIGIDLTRPAGKVAAPGSVAVVSAPFSIVTAVPSKMTRGDKVAIAIDPLPGPDTVGDGDSWQLTASGSCITDYLASTVSLSGASGGSGLLDAQGRFVFDTSKLSQQGPGSSCDVTLMVKHMHYSKLDPAFGSATAGLELAYSDAPRPSPPGDSGTVDVTYAVEGLQARAAHTSFTF